MSHSYSYTNGQTLQVGKIERLLKLPLICYYFLISTTTSHSFHFPSALYFAILSLCRNAYLNRLENHVSLLKNRKPCYWNYTTPYTIPYLTSRRMAVLEGLGAYTVPLLVVAALSLLLSRYVGVKMDPREPPLKTPTIPYVGHLIGMLTYQIEYIQGLMYVPHLLNKTHD